MENKSIKYLIKKRNYEVKKKRAFDYVDDEDVGDGNEDEEYDILIEKPSIESLPSPTTPSSPNNFNLVASSTSSVFNTKPNKSFSGHNPQINLLIGIGAGVVIIVMAGLTFFFVSVKLRNNSNDGKTIQQLKRSTSSGDWKRKSKITSKDRDEKQYTSESVGFIESESLSKSKSKSVDVSTAITITQQKDEIEKIKMPDLSRTSDSGLGSLYQQSTSTVSLPYQDSPGTTQEPTPTKYSPSSPSPPPSSTTSSTTRVSDIPLQINPIGSPREHSSPIYSSRTSPYYSPSQSGEQLDETLYLESIGPMSGSTGLQANTSSRETTRPRTQPYQIMSSSDPNISFRHSISSVPLHHPTETDTSSRETTRPRSQSYQTTSSSDPSDVSFRHDIASIPSGYQQQQQQQTELPSPSPPPLPGASRLSRSSASRSSRSSTRSLNTQQQPPPSQ